MIKKDKKLPGAVTFTISILIMIILFFNCTIFAQTEKVIPEYQKIHDSMVPMKVAITLAVGENQAQVTFGYVPGFGSIFTCEIQEDLDSKINKQMIELIKSFGPMLYLDERENICIIVRYSRSGKKQEYVIVAPKANVTNEEKWTVFNSGLREIKRLPQIVKSITAKKAYDLIQSYKKGCSCKANKLVIIDVRPSKEYINGHIKNAINLNPHSHTLRERLTELDKSKTYIVYCNNGVRSGEIINLMRELGFLRVYNILGGITQWEAEGLPLVK